jgi:hypothetical protein
MTGTGNPLKDVFPVGQGFIIDGLVNGTVQMKNSYRVFVKKE